MGGDQEEGRQPDGEERVGHGKLEREQEREVDGRHERMQRAVRLLARREQEAGRPEHEHGEYRGGPPVRGEAEDHHRHEGDQRDGEAGQREHHDRPG